MILHAGLMATRQNGTWRGVLIQGGSGVGKSDLALRLLQADWRLVADDRTIVWVSGQRLYGRAPDALSGLIEARGIGIIGAEALRYCQIKMLVSDGNPARVPEPAFSSVCGAELPLIKLALLEASSAAKITHAMWRLGARAEGAYLGDRAGSTSPLSGGDSR